MFRRRGRCSIAILSLLLAAAAHPLSPQSPGSTESEIVAEIARLDSVWLNAYVTADVEAVRPIIAEDFIGQIFQTIMDRGDLLERVAEARGIEAMILENLVVNVYDDVAVAHATRRQVTSTEEGRVDSRFVYTDVYRYRDGRWQCFTGQSAPVPDG